MAERVSFWMTAMVLIAACTPRGKPEPRVKLPRVSALETASSGRTIVLNLTDRGELLHKGDRISLADLTGVIAEEVPRVVREVVRASVRDQEVKGDVHEETVRYAWERTNVTVCLRIDASAPWCHAQWVLAVLAEHDLETVAIAVQVDYKTTGVLPLQLRWASPGSVIGVDGGEGAPVLRFETRSTRELNELTTWIRETAQTARFGIEVGRAVEWRHCAAVLSELHDLGADEVVWAMERPHPWVRIQETLPAPRRKGVISFTRSGFTVPVTLPVSKASVSYEDSEGDIIVSIDARGFVRYHGKSMNLEELATHLRIEREKQELRRQLDGHGSSGQLVIRADRDTPWKHVSWVLSVALEQRLTPNKIAASRIADLTYTEADARDLNLSREQLEPLSGCEVVGVAPLSLQTKDSDGGSLRIKTLSGRCVYSFEGRRTENLADVAKWLRSTRTTRIVVSDQVPWKCVVAALAEVGSVGKVAVQIDVTPDSSVRTKRPLPR